MRKTLKQLCAEDGAKTNHAENLETAMCGGWPKPKPKQQAEETTEMVKCCWSKTKQAEQTEETTEMVKCCWSKTKQAEQTENSIDSADTADMIC